LLIDGKDQTAPEHLRLCTMGCGVAVQRVRRGLARSNRESPIVVLTLRRSHLQDLVGENSSPRDRSLSDFEEGRNGGFSLITARFLAEMSGLVYLAGTYWASAKKGEGDLRQGMAGLSACCRYWVGGLNRDGQMQQPNRLGVVALSSKYDRTWDSELGTMRDGMISYTGKFLKNLLVDTHAMISRRPATKEIVITFRGSEFRADVASAVRDLVTNALALRAKWPSGAGKVHSGIHAAWAVVKLPIVETVRDLITSGLCSRLLCCGHSLGGGLAMFCGLTLAEEFPELSVLVYTYGGVAVGNKTFQKHFDRTIPACFRLVNDQDMVPHLFDGKAGYTHVGQLVKITRTGLWVSPTSNCKPVKLSSNREPVTPPSINVPDTSFSNEQPQRMPSSKLDRFYHHGIGDYQRLLDLFCATTSTNSVDEATIQSLMEAWRVYLRSPVQFETVLTLNSSGAQGVKRVRIAAPNSKGMCSVLKSQLGLTDDQVELIQSEMLRLVWWYTASEVDWPIFMIAAYELIFAPNQHEKEWRMNMARWYATFIKFDKNGDECLDRDEFTAMWKHEVLGGSNDDIPACIFKIMEDQFKVLGVDLNHKVSFGEYALWRQMCDPAETRKLFVDSLRREAQMTSPGEPFMQEISIRDDWSDTPKGSKDRPAVCAFIVGGETDDSVELANEFGAKGDTLLLPALGLVSR